MSNNSPNPQEYLDKALDNVRSGDQYVEENKLGKAIIQYQFALADCNGALLLDPGFVEAYYLRSKLFLILEDYGKAIADLTQILTLEGISVEDQAYIYNNRGDLFFNQKQYDKGFEDYKEMIALRPDEPITYLIRANKYALMGDHFTEEEEAEEARLNYELAIADCNQVLNIDPHNIEAYDLRSNLFLALLDYDKAIADLTQILTLEGMSVEDLAFYYNNRGDLFFNQKQYDKGFEDYKEMIALRPDEPITYLIRANKYALMGDRFTEEEEAEEARLNYELAIADCNQALNIDPHNIEAYDLRSNLFLALLDYDKAIADLTQILTLEGISVEDLAFYYNKRGDIFFNQKQYEKGFEDYEKMIALLPKKPEAYHFRAGMYAHLGDQFSMEENEQKANKNYQLALSDCDEALILKPNYIQAYDLRSKLFSALKDYDKAIADLTQILTLEGISVEDQAEAYNKRGDLFFNLEQREKAFEDFKMMIALLPDKPITYLIRANKYALMGDHFTEEEKTEEARLNYELAIADCNQALNIDPHNIEAYDLRSKLFLALEDYDKAIADLTQILTLEGISVEDQAYIYNKRGDLFFNQKKYDKGFEDYKEMIALRPDEPLVYFIRANKYAHLGDQLSMEENEKKAKKNYQLALSDCDEALKLDSNYIEAYELRSNLFLALEDYDKAIADLTQILTLEGISVEDQAYIYNKRGDLFFNQKQYDKGFEDYKEMITLRPDEPITYLIRANKYALMGDRFTEEEAEEARLNYELAIADCNQALNIAPHNIEAYDQRSKLFSALKDYDKAIADLTKILTQEGISVEDQAFIYNNRGDLFFSQKQYEKGFEDYKEMIALRPDEPITYFIRANKYALMGDRFTEEEEAEEARLNYELAIADCNQALNIAPHNIEAYELRSKLFSALKDYDKAIVDLTQILTLEDISVEDQAFIYSKRGELFFNQEQYKKAFKDYEKMITLLPKEPEAYHLRAGMYTDLGDYYSNKGQVEKAEAQYHQAIKDCDKVIELDDSFINAILLRSRLYWALKEFDKAEADLDKISEKGAPKETMAEVFLSKGDICFDKGNYKQAFTDYGEMIMLLPKDPQAYYLRANKYIIYGDQFLIDADQEGANKQYRLALNDLNEAIKLKPKKIDFYIDRNDLYLFLGDWEALEEKSNILIALAPNQYHGYFGKGTALREQERYTEALNVFNLAVEYSADIKPEEKADIYFGRAATYESLNNFRAALFNYESVVTFTPADPRGYIGLGNSLISLGDYFEAAQKFDFALELDDSNPISLNGRALALIGIGERFAELDEYAKMCEAYEKALNDCETSLNFAGEEFYSYYYRGFALRNLESYSKAVQAFDHALKIAEKEKMPILPNVYFEKGEALRMFGTDFQSFAPFSEKLEEAVKTFDQGIIHAPENSEDNILSFLYSGKGFTLIQLGDFEKAIASFEKAVDKHPGNLRALVGIGTAFYLRLDPLYEKAEVAFLKVLDIVSESENINSSEWLFDFESALIGLGLTYQRMNRKEEAKDAFEKAIQSQGKIPEFKRYINQAYILDVFKAIEKAEEYRLKAVKLENESAFAHNEIAWMYVDVFENFPKKLEDAFHHAEKAVKMEDKLNGNGLDTLGWICFKLKKYKDAEKYLAQAVELNKYDELISAHFDEARKKVLENTAT